MKARTVWILLGLVFLGLVGFQVRKVMAANKAPEEKRSEAALIRVEKVIRADMAEKISLTGTVRARNEVDIYAKVGGRIENVGAQVGDKIKAGQTLAVIEHKEISWQAKAAQASLAVARANLDGAKLEFDRTAALFKGGAAPQSAMDGMKIRMALAEAQTAQAEASAGLAQQQVNNASVESPINGTVIRRPVNVGSQVGPAFPLFTVQDVNTLKLESSVDASAFARLAKGAVATVTVDAIPDQAFEGKVALLSPALDALTRRATVELEIDNASGKLLPNMFAHGDVSVGQLSSTLVVPRAAVFQAAGGARVFRVKNGKVEALRPKLGPSEGDKVAVLEGLAEGDEVAVTGLANLSDGAEVKISTPAATAMNEGRK